MRPAKQYTIISGVLIAFGVLLVAYIAFAGWITNAAGTPITIGRNELLAVVIFGAVLIFSGIAIPEIHNYEATSEDGDDLKEAEWKYVDEDKDSDKHST